MKFCELRKGGGRRRAWTVIDFGKHEGKTLPQIALTDPDWLFWAIENGAFNNRSDALKAEAEDIGRKSTRIRIPNSQLPDLKVECVIHPGVGKLADVKVVPASRPPDVGSSSTFRLDHFNLSVPRRISPYDKFGGKVMVEAIKRYVFGNAKTRLTRARCEEFFNDDKHFA